MPGKINQPLHLPPYRYDSADATSTANSVTIWPGQDHDWQQQPILASSKAQLPIFWSKDQIQIFNPFIGAPQLLPLFYREAPETFAQIRQPLRSNLRAVLFGGRALEAAFVGTTLAFSTLNTIVASIGGSVLDDNNITLSTWAPLTFVPFNLTESYFNIGLPAHTEVATDSGFSAFSYCGVVDASHFQGAEILVLTGTDINDQHIWYVHQTAFGNRTFTETRAQEVANVQAMLQACKKFRMVHYVPNAAVWLDHKPSGGLITFGEWSASLDAAINAVGSADVLAKYSDSLAAAPLGPRYDPADMVTEIMTFFDL